MPYLIYAPDTEKEKFYYLKFGSNTIGRSEDNQIVVMDESLSRHHAEIDITVAGVTVKDLQSLNHTFVNNHQIEQSPLLEGDIIHCGNVEFKFVATTAQKQPSISPEKTAPLPKHTTIVKQFSPSQLSSIKLENPQSSRIKHQSKSTIKLAEKNRQERTTKKLEILLEVSKELSSPTEPALLLEKILDLVMAIIDVDRSAIIMREAKTAKLLTKAVKCRTGIECSQNFYSTSIINWVFEQEQGIITTNAKVDQRFNTSHSIIAQAIQASICIPLKPRQEIIGVLYVDNLSMANIYCDEDVEFLTAIANQAAISLDNSRLYEKIQAEAILRSKLERFFPQAIHRKLKEEDSLKIVDTEVTALFADITGFTRMSATMEPRQVITMLNDYFQVMVEEIIFSYQGTLEKYIGDALFAVWGAPYRQPDDPDRAIKAAVDMQWAVQTLNQRWQKQGRQPIQIHIGLNTGKVAAGNIGSSKLIQYATIGDTTNVTSRICAVAKADEIMISQTTYQASQHLNLTLEKLPPVKVKGKEKPLQLYRLLWQKMAPTIKI